MNSLRTVKITIKRGSTGKASYSVALPKELLREVNILKIIDNNEVLATNILIARVIEYEIEPGRKVKGIFYHKP
ncbi:MAG: hypothetical protein DRN49_03090 [Thaumarchaeota archaeon]|nr:MAG: hypothetical protein DRN49_03090 [Nitrososphaerota archaeon]